MRLTLLYYANYLPIDRRKYPMGNYKDLNIEIIAGILMRCARRHQGFIDLLPLSMKNEGATSHNNQILSP